jgi:hypothetical protein
MKPFRQSQTDQGLRKLGWMPSTAQQRLTQRSILNGISSTQNSLTDAFAKFKN